jgi:hypothetical protein
LAVAAAVLAVLVLSLPAWWIAALPASAAVTLVSTSGSLLGGQGWLAWRERPERQPVPLLPLAWSLAWRHGPVLRLSTARGDGWLRPAGPGLVLESPPFDLSLSQLPLPSPLGTGGLAGWLRAEPGHFECAAGSCRGELRATVDGLALRLFPGERLADADLRLESEPGGATAHLRLGGRGVLEGRLILAPGDPVSVEGVLRPKAGASQALVSAVASLGSVGADGTIIRRP